MAYRLGDYVVYGELRNTQNYSTRGFLLLRGATPGEDLAVHLELTGNCAKDFNGKHVRFRPEVPDKGGAVFRREEHVGFQDRQIGPTGSMTAEGWVRTFDCSVEEFVRRSMLGEPPPTTWKRRLYLEWSSQNGRVVVELGGAIVEECVREPRAGDEHDEGDWRPLLNFALPPELDTSPKPAGPSFAVVRMEDDTAYVEHWTPPAKDFEVGEDDPPDPQLDREMEETELIDYCIEHSEEKPLSAFIGNALELPAPEDLDDDEVESRLGGLLAQMALLGVALDVCEHFSPRDCYRLLRDRLLDDDTVFEELIGTGWVTHIPTNEFCDACEKQFEKEYEESEQAREGEGLN